MPSLRRPLPEGMSARPVQASQVPEHSVAQCISRLIISHLLSTTVLTTVLRPALPSPGSGGRFTQITESQVFSPHMRH